MPTSSSRALLALALLLLSPLVAARHSAQTTSDSSSRASLPPLIPLERLFEKPRVLAVQLDPAGTTLAVVERDGAHPAIALYDTAGGGKRFVYRDTVRSISNVRWSADGRWLLFLHDRGGDEGYHLLRLDPRTPSRGPRDLTPFAGAEVELLALPSSPAGAGAIIASNHRDPRASDVYRVDLATGGLELLARNPGDVTVWGVTPKGRVLAASAVLRDGTLEVRTRARPSAPWRAIYHAPPDERFTLLGVEDEGGGAMTIVARTNRGGDYERFVWIDPNTGAVLRDRASACEGFDAGELVRDHAFRTLGESCSAASRRFAPSDSGMRRAVERLRLGDGDARDTLRAVEFESASADGSRMVLYTQSATDPGRYVLVDRNTSDTRRTLFEMRPGLDRAQLAPTEFHWFTARDGLRLSALLTRSPIARGTAQPVVVAVHGGPWSRDAVGFVGETQLLANRGYAVLQVNFRGSTGLGRKTLEGGVGEFGGRMSDDLVDALRWAASLGAVDTTRACILGGSYGGFAALTGVTRDARHFKCGVDYAGPFDLETLVRAFPPSWGPFLPRSWYRFVGNPADSAARVRMRNASPLAHLDSARAPLLVFQGANDPRVRTEQAVQVMRSWRARQLPAQLLLADDEGHSFNEEATALAVSRGVEEFLARWLGGRKQEVVEPRVEEALKRLRASGERVLAEPAVRDSAAAAVLEPRRHPRDP